MGWCCHRRWGRHGFGWRRGSALRKLGLGFKCSLVYEHPSWDPGFICFIFRAQKGNSLDILWYFFGLFTKYFIEKKIIFENKLLAVFPMSFRGPCDAWPNELKEMYLTVMYLLLPPWPSAGQIWYEYAKWRIVLYSYRIHILWAYSEYILIYLNMFLTPKSRRIWHKKHLGHLRTYLPCQH